MAQQLVAANKIPSWDGSREKGRMCLATSDALCTQRNCLPALSSAIVDRLPINWTTAPGTLYNEDGTVMMGEDGEPQITMNYNKTRGMQLTRTIWHCHSSPWVSQQQSRGRTTTEVVTTVGRKVWHI